MSSDKCRERFEEHYRLAYNMTRSGSVYVKTVTTIAWRAWQAAWTASREEAAKELVTDAVIVPVTYVDGGAMLPPKLAEDAT